MNDDESLVALTADITAAFVSNNQVPVNDVSRLVQSIHSALSSLGTQGRADLEGKTEPAVPIRSSVRPDYIVCLEDGKKLKMLKRHLMTHYNMTPAEYRAKWNLKPDYPMVAPNYAATRKELALKIGLGRKKGGPETPSGSGASKSRRRKAAA